MQHDHDRSTLSWRIPDGRLLTSRAGALQILFAGLITVGFLLIFGGGAMLAAIAAAAVLAGLAGYWLYVRWRDAAQPDENVWLDGGGLHWREAGGREGNLPRDQVEGFRIGLDPDTVRALPALTLLLVGGFESQPIELHAPATPQQVRQYLVEQWRLSESPLDDGEFAALLSRCLNSSLASEPRPSLASRLLLCRLVEPQRQSDGAWLVAKLGEANVSYQPSSCLFLVVGFGDTYEAGNVADLVDYVRDHLLPDDATELAQLSEELDRAQRERDVDQVATEARRAGFYFEGDDSLRFWKFVGARSKLLALCGRIEEAAKRFKPPPPGAKPAELRIGGELVGITIRVDRHDWIAGDTICGRRESLVDLSQSLRDHIAATADLSTSEFETPFDAGGKWKLRIELMSERFDPGECVERTAESV